MRISSQRLAESVTIGLWDELSRCQGATFFHSGIWSQVLESSFSRWQAAPISWEFSDGNVALLPLMKRPGLLGLGVYKESMIPGVYGGPIFLRRPTKNHWDEFWKSTEKVSNVIIYGNPFLEQSRFPEHSTTSMSTHALDLSPGVNSVLKCFRKGHMAAVKAARRKGLEITIASSLDDVSAYFDIYQRALTRWGNAASGFYPAELFRNLFQLPSYGEKVKLWLAKNNRTVIAGIWVFYHNDHAVYWHGVTEANHFSDHPAHLLVTSAIEEACGNALRWFDFNPSGGLKGVEHFKRGFGAKPLDFFVYRRLGATGKGYRVSRQVKQTLLGTCPL